MALRSLLLRASTAALRSGQRNVAAVAGSSSRFYSEDVLGSLLDQNVERTRKPGSGDPKQAVRAKQKGSRSDGMREIPEANQAPKQEQAKVVPATSEEEAEIVPEEVELLPEFGSDAELIKYVTGVLMESDWRELHGKLARLGDQVKSKHVPEILKRSQDSKVVFSFFKWAQARKLTETDPSLLRLMFVILSSRDNVDKPDEMQSLLVEMHAKGLQLENSMFVTVMQAFTRMNRVPEARRLFWKMDGLDCRPKTSTYNAILRVLLDAGSNLEFDMIYFKMKGSGREPDSTTYEIVIEKTCRAGKADDAYKLLEEMKTKYSPSRSVYASLVRCLSRAGNEGLALEVMNEMDKPGEEVYNPVVLRMVETGKLASALTEYKRMLELGVRPNSPTCVAILSELVVTEKTSQACTLFGEMNKAGYIAASEVLQVAEQSYKKCKLEIVWSFLKGLCEEQQCPFEAETVHALVQGLMGRKRVDIARRLFRCVTDAGKKPSVETYNLFIRSLNTVDAAKQIFELMEKNGSKPDVETYNGMLESLTKGGLYTEALQLFRRMMEEGLKVDAETYKLVVGLLAKDAGLGMDTVVETLRMLQVKGGFQGAGAYLEKLSRSNLLPPEEPDKDGKLLVKILHKDARRFDDIYM